MITAEVNHARDTGTLLLVGNVQVLVAGPYRQVHLLL